MSDRIEYMCPHCGWRFDALLATKEGKVPPHPVRGYKTGMTCPGMGQVSRNPETDRRPLWIDLPGGRPPAEHERSAPPLCGKCGQPLSRHRPLIKNAADPRLICPPAEWLTGPILDRIRHDAEFVLRQREGGTTALPIDFPGDLACHVLALLGQVERLDRYRRAMESMAAQFLCPKTTAEDMVRQILGEDT